MIWLQLWWELLELGYDSSISKWSDFSLFSLLSILNCCHDWWIFSYFLKSFLNNFLFDKFTTKFKIFFTGKNCKIINLIFSRSCLEAIWIKWLISISSTWFVRSNCSTLGWGLTILIQFLNISVCARYNFKTQFNSKILIKDLFKVCC